jgi:membrane protease YdiL (CAAX protease family)
LITPIANTTLVMRDILRGHGSIGAFMLAFCSSLVYAGLLLSLAARLFSNEQLVNPGWEPLSLKGLGRRGGVRKPRLPAVDEAIALFAVCLLLMFYVQPSLMPWGLFATLAISQIFLFFVPAALFALIGKWQWRATFKLRAPGAAALAGGFLLGLGLVPIVQLLSRLQRLVWPPDSATEKFINDLFVPVLQAHPFITPVIVGVLAGIFEELLFRGPIQTALMRKNNPWVAVIITALLFAAAHLDLHGMALRAALGIILGWVVWRTGSIFPAMIIHAVYDTGTTALGAWDVHHLAADDIGPILNGWGALRLALGIAMTACRLLIFLRQRPVDMASPERGFEPILHNAPVSNLPT